MAGDPHEMRRAGTWVVNPGLPHWSGFDRDSWIRAGFATLERPRRRTADSRSRVRSDRWLNTPESDDRGRSGMAGAVAHEADRVKVQFELRSGAVGHRPDRWCASWKVSRHAVWIGMDRSGGMPGIDVVSGSTADGGCGGGRGPRGSTGARSADDQLGNQLPVPWASMARDPAGRSNGPESAASCFT